MKVTKCSLLAIFAIAICALPAGASVIYTGAPIPTFTFDGMASSTSATGTTQPATFSTTTGVQVAVPASGGWEATRFAGTGSSAMPYVADHGVSNTGGIHSYGPQSGSDRALGSLASGTNHPAYGLEIVNNTNGVQFEVRISFTQENWRTSTTTINTIQASYATSDTAGVTSSNFLTATGFTDVNTLDLVGPPTVTTNGALDGNLAINQAARSAIITGLSIDPGQSFFLRFQDADDVGSDAGLAIDNFNIQLIPEPTSFALMFTSIGAMLFRRK
jgi:hypothetical protein